MNKSLPDDIEIPDAAFRNGVVRRGGAPAWETVPAPARDAARLSSYLSAAPLETVPLDPDIPYRNDTGTRGLPHRRIGE